MGMNDPDRDFDETWMALGFLGGAALWIGLPLAFLLLLLLR
jgi:hypothetical protein